MAKKIGLAVAAVVVLLLVVVAVQPSEYTVIREQRIEAPIAQVHTVVNDFAMWPKWSPWEKRDPSMSKTISSPSSGKGATYEWSGNDEVGKGRMVIEESSPTEVKMSLEFIEPFASKADTAFLLREEGPGATVIAWKMTGYNDFMGKAFGLVMDMDAMIGADFEEGLASLDRIVVGTR